MVEPEENLTRAELLLENQELRRSNEELERFAYFAAHDLRAPLRHIGSFSELLAEKVELLEDGESAEWLATIRKSVQKMSRLTDQLLELARVGARSPVLEQVDVAQVCHEAVETLRYKERSALEFVRLEASGKVVSNSVHLRSLVQNLVDNALRHGCHNAPPDVTVSFSCSPKSWTLRVQDCGPGISESDQLRIFEPFTQLRGTGSGLGLSICSQIVRSHGGTIRAESEPGKGCCMIVSLPLPGPSAD